MRRTSLAVLTLLLFFPALTWVTFPVFNRASPRVAFMGDSLTQGWLLPRENFGIFGQTTAQMLDRFQRQVPGHDMVVILGGTNDTLLHIDPSVTVENLGRMVDLAQADRAEPILAEIPPIYRDHGALQSAVDRLNAAIVLLATQRRVKLVNYNGALRGHEDAYSDGTHLKRRGYLRMELALLRVTNIF